MPAGLPACLPRDARRTATPPGDLYNGFAAADVVPYEPLLDRFEHEALRLATPVQDIPAYLSAARQLECEFLCLCNSYSTPLASDGWRSSMHRQRSPG